MATVVYFDQLLGACSTRKLVETYKCVSCVVVGLFLTFTIVKLKGPKKTLNRKKIAIIMLEEKTLRIELDEYHPCE